ncbi:MAG TPA: FtsX-like permease family protein [Gemmataceae bacterium]|nr:FtsX-like permease family protein [Gemmataceae bacterium]
MNKLPVPLPLLVVLAAIVAVLAALLFAGKVPLSYNFRNLVVRWRMTVLTALAFTLVISLLTVMLAFVNGMAKLTEGSGYAENVVVLADGANDEAFSSMSFTDTSNIGRRPNTNEIYPASKELYVIASMPIPPREGSAAGKSVRGSIKKVSIDDNRLVITDAKNLDHQVQLAANCKVVTNQEALGLIALKPGDIVWMAYQDGKDVLEAAEIRASSKRRFVQVRGIEDPEIASDVHRVPLLEGRWFDSAGVLELPLSAEQKVSDTAIQAVVGEGLARELGRDVAPDYRLQVGDVFELGQGRESSSPKKWVIVGITKSEGTTFSSELWAKRTNIGELYGKPSTISSISIRTGSEAEAKEFARYLREEYRDANLQTQTEIEYFAKLQGTNQQFTFAIGFFTIFMAIGGIFGVMNTMFAAISQRQKDIGVLRILGYARWQILISFLLESLLIAVVGGLVGCAIGSLSNGWTATSVVGSGQGGFGKTVVLRLAVGANTIAVGVLLTLLMGLLGGLLPAWRATRLKPLEAMR